MKFGENVKPWQTSSYSQKGGRVPLHTAAAIELAPTNTSMKPLVGNECDEKMKEKAAQEDEMQM